MKTTLLRIGAIAVALQILSASAETQVLYVVPSGTAGNTPASPYTTWETAANSIADALGAVTDEAVINVKPGVYNIDKQITVNKPNVTIQSCDENGSLARETTILDGGYPARYPKATTNRLFQIQRENVKLRGLTLQNAYVSDIGGGYLLTVVIRLKYQGRQRRSVSQIS
jgi:pectin methylesterase-like acyl-CoA thioesterase